MNVNDERIREFAYQIWQSEGKPHGQAKRHWEMACKLAESHSESENQQSAQLDSPAKSSKKIKAKSTALLTTTENTIKKPKVIDKKTDEKKLSVKNTADKKVSTKTNKEEAKKIVETPKVTKTKKIATTEKQSS